MRKRIQHHRKQRPSRVQLVRIEPLDRPEAAAQLVAIEERDLKRFGANVDGRPLRWAAGRRKGERATFDTAERAEREALFALACRYLDRAGWQALQAVDRDEPHDALAVIDLLELGLVDDDSQVNAAGRQVLERLDKPAPDVPEGPPRGMTAGELAGKLHIFASAGAVDLDKRIKVQVKIDGRLFYVSTLTHDESKNRAVLEVQPIEVPA